MTRVTFASLDSQSAALTWSTAGTSAPFVVTKGPLEVKFSQPACNCFKTRQTALSVPLAVQIKSPSTMKRTEQDLWGFTCLHLVIEFPPLVTEAGRDRICISGALARVGEAPIAGTRRKISKMGFQVKKFILLNLYCDMLSISHITFYLCPTEMLLLGQDLCW